MAANHPSDYPAPSDYFQVRRVTYPESDGEPMAETEQHGETLEDIRSALRLRYADDARVQVGGNCFMYYVEGDPKRCVSPDVYVIFGVPKGLRRNLKLWEEGKPPDVVFEVTSRSTKLEDLGTKKGLYAVLGVREYILYDPYGDYLDPPLQGYRLVGGDYRPIAGKPLVSKVLGLAIAIAEHRPYALRFVDVRTGEPALSAPESAEHEAQRADREAERAEQEAEARRAAEARIAELEARLAGLRDDGA